MVMIPSPSAGAVGSIPGQGTQVPHASGCGPKKKKTPNKIETSVETQTTQTIPDSFCPSPAYL